MAPRSIVKGPTTVVFAAVAAGSTGASKPVRISNLSQTATVKMGTANPSGPFIKVSDTCSNTSLKPNGKCAIGLKFLPPLGSPSKTTLAGSLGLDFTYGSNSGLVPAISLTGTVK